jgi:hypothetical protein
MSLWKHTLRHLQSQRHWHFGKKPHGRHEAQEALPSQVQCCDELRALRRTSVKPYIHCPVTCRKQPFWQWNVWPMRGSFIISICRSATSVLIQSLLKILEKTHMTSEDIGTRWTIRIYTQQWGMPRVTRLFGKSLHIQTPVFLCSCLQTRCLCWLTGRGDKF